MISQSHPPFYLGRIKLSVRNPRCVPLVWQIGRLCTDLDNRFINTLDMREKGTFEGEELHR